MLGSALNILLVPEELNQIAWGLVIVVASLVDSLSRGGLGTRSGGWLGWRAGRRSGP